MILCRIFANFCIFKEIQWNYFVDFEKCWKMSIWLQNLALIQPRTSVWKSAICDLKKITSNRNAGASQRAGDREVCDCRPAPESTRCATSKGKGVALSVSYRYSRCRNCWSANITRTDNNRQNITQLRRNSTPKWCWIWLDGLRRTSYGSFETTEITTSRPRRWRDREIRFQP